MRIPLEAFQAAQAAALAGDLDTAWQILRENCGRPIAGAASCKCLECFSRFAYGPLYKQAVKDHQKAEALAAAQVATLAGDVATSARIIQENRLGKRCAFCLHNPLRPHLRVDRITVVRGVQVHAHSLCLSTALELGRIRSWETGRWVYIQGLMRRNVV